MNSLGMRKKLMVGILLFAFMLLILSGTKTMVEAKGNLGIQGFVQKGENLDISFSGVRSPKEKDVKVNIGEQEFQAEKIVDGFHYKKKPSFVFLIDVSGSINSSQYTFMKDVMKELVTKAEAETIKILLVGEKVVAFDAISGGKDAMFDKIDSIEKRAGEAGTNTTSLYEGIVKALETARTDKTMTLLKNVVIFSDGFETSSNSLTQSEVMDAVKEARIPVFTVPVAVGQNVGAGEDTNEILSSFARKSYGGVAGVFSSLKNKKEIIENIVKAIKNINVVTINIKKLETGTDSRILKLRHKSESDSIELDMSKLKLKKENKEAEVKMETESDQKKSSNFPLIIAVIGTTVLIAVLLLMFVLKQLKSGKVTLIFNMGNGDIRKPMKDKFVIGRDSGKTDFSMPSDSRLSSKHCMIYLDNKNLYIKDLDSTNGTYLNGKRIKGANILSMGDILLIGSVEMKISWER